MVLPGIDSRVQRCRGPAGSASRKTSVRQGERGTAPVPPAGGRLQGWGWAALGPRAAPSLFPPALGGGGGAGAAAGGAAARGPLPAAPAAARGAGGRAPLPHWLPAAPMPAPRGPADGRPLPPAFFLATSAAAASPRRAPPSPPPSPRFPLPPPSPPAPGLRPGVLALPGGGR